MIVVLVVLSLGSPQFVLPMAQFCGEPPFFCSNNSCRMYCFFNEFAGECKDHVINLKD